MADLKTAHEMARILTDSFGDRASREAARREIEARDQGDEGEAQDWRKVRDVLSEMRGPRET